MNTQALGVEYYLAGMRAALDDLPPNEVAEIMEDVEAHIAELSTELRRTRPSSSDSGRLSSTRGS